MKEDLLKKLKEFDSTLYGLELSAKECHEIIEYIETLENALCIASRVLDDGYGEEYVNHLYITYMDKVVEIPHIMTIEKWYEWLLENGRNGY